MADGVSQPQACGRADGESQPRTCGQGGRRAYGSPRRAVVCEPTRLVAVSCSEMPPERWRKGTGA